MNKREKSQQIWDFYKSVKHKVVIEPEKHHLAIATFLSPNIKAMVGPLADLLKENKAKCESIRYEDYLSKVRALYMRRRSSTKKTNYNIENNYFGVMNWVWHCNTLILTDTW